MATADIAAAIAQASRVKALAWRVLPYSAAKVAAQPGAVAAQAGAMWRRIDVDPQFWRALPNSAGAMFP